MEAQSNRMTEGDIRWHIIKFAIPLLLGNIFQQLYNIIDTVIIGRFLGEQALAAVTSSTQVVMLLVNFFAGVFSGAGIIVSRYFGSKDDNGLSKSIGNAIALALIGSVVITAIGVVVTPSLLVLISTPEEVLNDSIKYLQTYFAGISSLVLYNAASGIYQAVGDSKRPLRYLAISAVLNVVLDILFVAVFGMGITSVAVATIISQAVSAILAFGRLYKINEPYKVSINIIRVDKNIMKDTVRIGLPTGIQNSITSIANIFVQSSINLFGTVVIAGIGAYNKVEMLGFTAMMALSMTTTVFVSQNIGAGYIDRAKKGAVYGTLYCVILAQTIGTLVYIFAPHIIGVFSDNPEVIAIGVLKSKITPLFFFVVAFTHSASGVLRGCGKSKVPMYTVLICWCILRSIYVSYVTNEFFRIELVIWAYPITWIMSSSFLIFYMFKKIDWNNLNT